MPFFWNLWKIRPISELFFDSARELRKPRALVLTAQFAALQVVSALFTITLFSWLRISFGFVFQSATAMLFGPVVAGLQGIVADVAGFLLHPSGPFFPGYTLSALLSGVVYGCAFYGERVDWKRALCAKALVNLLINICLGTLWAKLLYNQAFWAMLASRALKNAVLLIVETPLLVVTYDIVQSIRRRRR